MGLPTDELKKEHRDIERMLKIVWDAANMLEAGRDVDVEIFRDAAGFFKEYGDEFHRRREERLLFDKMVARGVPTEHGPLLMMRNEHEEGREHVRKIAELSSQKLTKKVSSELLTHVREYVSLQSQHIQKEDGILYPIANDVLTARDQIELGKGFAKADVDAMTSGVQERYRRMIEAWEKKLG
jgi:hemerythrin-like domain-containing protein